MDSKLVEKFLANPKSMRMGCGKLSRRWRVSEEAIKEARNKARRILRQDDVAVTSEYIDQLQETVANFRENVQTGEANCSFSTLKRIRTKEDLVESNMLDLDNFEIVTYEITTWEGYRKDKKTDLTWKDGTSNGYVKDSGKLVTETLYRVNVKLKRRTFQSDPGFQIEAIKEAVEASLFESAPPSPYVLTKVRNTNGRALVVVTTDEHVAAANLNDDLYNIPYNRTEYNLRKIAVLEEVAQYAILMGPFDQFINITLGDSLDGWNAGTTRSGEPGHAHVLPQNMNNKGAVETFIRTNNYYWDRIMAMGIAKEYFKYDVVNSNHGGNGLDYIANLGVQIYLEARHPNVKIEYIHKFIGHFRFGQHNVLLTHGKDENYRKKPLPLNLDPATEVFIKQYMDYHSISAGHNILLKGDLHQWNWNSGKFFDYINVGSLYGSSGWVQANYGLTKPSFAIGTLDSQSSDFNLKPVYLEIPPLS